MTLTKQASNHNFFYFLWHALFLALSKNFMDIDTIIPAMILDAGGSSFQLGLLTAVMISSGQVSQLFFAPYLSSRQHKKPFLLTGITLRIFSLAALAILFVSATKLEGNLVILLIFSLIAIFSVSGGFANINYMDILGKSMAAEKRKPFFSIKQIITSLGFLASAYFARQILKSAHYPKNYTYLFGIAAFLLGIASIGFWKIREHTADSMHAGRLKQYLKNIYAEISGNQKLKYYLLMLNTQGVVLVLIPFLILFAKNNLSAANQSVGNFLLLKVTGSVIAGALLFIFAKKLRYQFLLYINAIAAIIISLAVIILPQALLFPYIFLPAGLIFAFYRMSIGGVLLEVTNSKNRALYTGITGAGNIIPGIYPIFGGWLVAAYGFSAFFSLTIIFLLISIYFVHQLNCKH